MKKFTERFKKFTVKEYEEGLKELRANGQLSSREELAKLAKINITHPLDR